MRLATILRRAVLLFALAGLATMTIGCPHGRHFHHH
ncbi:MAG: hypothetical protein FD180_3176 [Planctomycetota bacterium]|nr:MAG: hypothetical protein FD180_3176 [Planctomycetota bacterium]